MNDITAKIVVSVVMLKEDGSFILVKEKSGDDFVYDQPSDFLKTGESLETAVIRVSRELTGYDVIISNFIESYIVHFNEGKSVYVKFCYLCRMLSDEPIKKIKLENAELIWIHPDEMYELITNNKFKNPTVPYFLINQYNLTQSPDAVKSFFI